MLIIMSPYKHPRNRKSMDTGEQEKVVLLLCQTGLLDNSSYILVTFSRRVNCTECLIVLLFNVLKSGTFHHQ